jgi:hypothetical protein
MASGAPPLLLRVPIWKKKPRLMTRPGPEKPFIHPVPSALPTHQWVYRHNPSLELPVASRWPTSWESQAVPSHRIPAIEDVWIWLHPFLDAADRQNLRNVATAYRLGPEWSNLWLYRPWAPNRRRTWGFGRTSPGRYAGHDSPSQHVILHFTWTYLAPADRRKATLVCPYWHLYHWLRRQAAVTSLAPLQ